MASSASLKADRKNKEKERDTYKKRKKKIDVIRSSIGNYLPEKIAAININVENCASFLSSGLIGSSKVGSVKDSILDVKEKSTSADTTVTSYKEKLKNESTRCEKKINSLDEEITRMKRLIKTVEAEERKEHEKALMQSIKDAFS